jgi:hypothetical protein
MFGECLVYCSMHLGIPFIAPRQLGAVGDQIGRQFLPSVGWRTRQSGAPPDMNINCPVPDLLPFLAKPTVTPGFKGQSRVHLIHAPKKTTYIITECIEINVTIIRVFIT